MGFENATPIQAEAIPHILKNKDILGIAQTGTGKTAAFLLPTMDRILDTPDDGKVKALIVVPTRELAMQIDQAAEGFGYYTGVTSLAIYGGGSGKEFAREKQALKEGADIVVVTPGRMLSHLSLGYVDLSELEVLILDEADRMLDMGFHQDIMRIASHCKADRQTLLFSATMPEKMRSLAHELLKKDPVTIQLALSKPSENVKQSAYVVFEHQKDEVLVHLLKERNIESGIIFTSRKRTVNQVVRALRNAGLKCGKISSDLKQEEREEVMLGFRQKKIPLLVATDVVSRGIDIDSIEIVVNYDVPPNEEDYVHRIGRTARAERKGEAFTLITPDDMRRFGNIEKLIERPVDKLELPSKVGPGPKYDPKFVGGRGGGSRGGNGRRGDSGGRSHNSTGGSKNRSKGKGGYSNKGRTPNDSRNESNTSSSGRRMKGSQNKR
ncbi:MAG: ATP-dependent RNA helicase [Bacteroidetes bacterium]|nr:MAG: ATP-dependent RNA helicase [Bacteroidota bacterium]